MTNRMFEYALVFEETETPNISLLSAEFLTECLQENADFIRLAGFEPQFSLPDFSCNIMCDPTMLKRIFNNLFSNIIKYGDKKEPVTITGSQESQFIKIILRNTVKSEHSDAESTQIGLKSVRQMMTMMNGTFSCTQEQGSFSAVLTFPL